MVIVRSAPGASIDAVDASNAFAHMMRVSPVGVVMPEVPLPNDLKMSATRANSWLDNRGHRFVLLDGDPRLRIGSYHFRATGMVVRLTPVPGPRPDVYSVAIFLDDLTELGGYGPIRQSAEHLLVTAHIEGAVQLETDRLIREPADADPIVTDARARFARHEAALVQNITNLSDVPDMDIADATRQQRRRQLTSRRSSVPRSVIDIIEAEQDRSSIGPFEAPAGPSATAVDLDPSEDQSPGFQLPGRVLYAADSWEFQVGDAESTLTLVGNIRVVYLDPQTKRGMTLTADKAVIFLDVGGFDPDAGQALTAGTVRGVYLEDHVVATDGDYTLRGPRVFYDLTTDRAIVLDAVFHSWDIKQKVPIYVRAESLRQLSRTQWSATNARLTTSEFHEPHFAIGMNKLVVTQHDNEDQPTQFSYVANDTSLNIGNTPVFGWPTLSGDATKPPIRAIDVGYDSQNGAEIQTRWDIFALMDKRPPDGLDASLLIDGFSRRGAAIGIEAEYDVPGSLGVLDAYYLYDTGKDEPSGRDEVDPPTNSRGRAVWRHRQLLPDDWDMIVEAAWVSDPTFVEEFFRSEAYNAKPFETLVYFKKSWDDAAFTVLMKRDLTKFLPQLSRLEGNGNIPQLPGYSVDKLPEIAYYRPGTPVFDNQLTWYSENRASVMRFRLPRHSLRQLGFNTAESIALFGLTPTMQLDKALEAAGLDEDLQLRGDTRQELQWPLKVGPVDVVPYIVGRLTAYNDTADDFSSDSDNTRLWGAAGLKFHTALSKTISDVDSRFWDLHRLRHVIEPSAHFMFAETNLKQEHLPVYDYDVESLAEGGIVKFGLRNTFQTQRGGPGRWRSVDWLRIDTDIVLNTDDTHRESPLARFFDQRPEWSIAGDHFFGEVAWQLSDSLAMVGNALYNFETSTTEQWNYGVQLDHTPRLRSSLQVRHIEAFNSTVMRYAIEYLLTPKYHITLSQSFDFGHNQSNDVSIVLTRRMPRWLLMVSANYDTLGDISSVGLSIAPEGVGGGIARPDRNPFLLPEMGPQ